MTEPIKFPRGLRRQPCHHAPLHNLRPQVRAIVGLTATACIAVSLIWPLGMMAASSILMGFGVWCLLAGWWKWQPEDNPLAIVNATFAVYALGSALLSLVNGDPLSNSEACLPFLAACFLGIGLRVAQPRAFQVGAGFAIATIMAAAVSVAQVAGASEMHRAKILLIGTTFGTMGALYSVICVSMLSWPGIAGSPARRSLLLAGATCGVIVALLSGSKGSWLTLALAAVLGVIASIGHGAPRRTCLWLAGLAMLAGTVILLPNSPVVPRIKEAWREGDRCRAAYWSESVGLFLHFPLTGAGRIELKHRLQGAMLRARNGVPFPEGPPTDAHNEYLDALASRGLAGAGLVLAALGVPFVVLLKMLPRAQRPPVVAGLVFIVAFAASGLTDVLFGINIKRMAFLFFVLFCLEQATRQNEPPRHS